jgi:hypothetical protein
VTIVWVSAAGDRHDSVQLVLLWTAAAAVYDVKKKRTSWHEPPLLVMVALVLWFEQT